MLPTQHGIQEGFLKEVTHELCQCQIEICLSGDAYPKGFSKFHYCFLILTLLAFLVCEFFLQAGPPQCLFAIFSLANGPEIAIIIHSPHVH